MEGYSNGVQIAAMKLGALLAAVVVSAACAGAGSTNAPTPSLETVENPSPAAHTSASAGGTERDFSNEELAVYSNKRAMEHIRTLADIGPRVRAKTSEYKASKYIRATLRDYGYTIKVQKFSVDGGTSRNIVAWWPGAKRYGLVVGAHMDTVRGSRGANDNASGVAVMLEMARISVGRTPARFVHFVAFGSEEYGTNGEHHNGSQVYVNRLGVEGRKRLGGMASIDMIGNGRPLIAGTAGIGPEITARTIYNKMKQKVGMSYRTVCDCSDNGPFERAGIPGAFIWSGFDDYYHSPSDTVGNLKPRHVRRTGRGFRFFLKHVDLDMVRRFRRGR
jgi:hypothetical protein